MPLLASSDPPGTRGKVGCVQHLGNVATTDGAFQAVSFGYYSAKFLLARARFSNVSGTGWIY
jgi:hypothetical protein